MTTEERLRKIADIGKRNEEHKISIEMARKEEWEKAKATIKSYAERIKQLVDIANALCANKIHLGRYIGGLIEADEFYAEGFYHRLGFIANGNFHYTSFVPVLGIGIKGGGCDGYDLVINAEGEIVDGLPTQFAPRGELGKVRKLISEFDKFEQRVLEYVDSLK